MIELTLIFKILSFWVTFFTILYIMNWIYMKKGWQPKPFSTLDTLPFNCDRCCTTWTLIAVYIMEGLYLNDILYTLFGIIIAAGWGIGRYIQDKRRFEE